VLVLHFLIGLHAPWNLLIILFSLMLLLLLVLDFGGFFSFLRLFLYLVQQMLRLTLS
jgi:hypothetical protein